MLPKEHRLGGRERFEAIFRSRKAIFDTDIALFFQPHPGHATRIGFTFKQKAFPRAASRHFLKRKGSAIMRELLPTLPAGLDIVVLFHRRPSVMMTSKTLRPVLENLIKRLIKEKR